MLEPHAPHEPIHDWKGFLVHIMAIVVGLFIAVGIEQTVEFFHHRHQRHRLESQMHEVLEFDRRSLADNLASLEAMRAYLTELRAAIIARREGRAGVAQPPVDDERMKLRAVMPSLAPYEAARENGTVAQLPDEEIRIYNRLGYQRELALAEQAQLLRCLGDLGAFEERFVDSPGIYQFGEVVAAPDVSRLGVAELAEYLALVSTAIKNLDTMIQRFRVFSIAVGTVADGVSTEHELVGKIFEAVQAGLNAPQAH